MNPMFNENQEVLQKFINDGVDLSFERDIEFAHQASDRTNADQFAAAASLVGYEVDVHAVDEEGISDGMLPWDIICTIQLLPTCELITKHELFLSDLATKNGCMPDGWMFSAH